ncbi:short-chain dehydrogenase [Paucilactobacillus hokkaidonensis JCM 18461]|uniref:Short-chain dehydrogenase n=1 Tax=Paucilactobacillus hokkaidonensis JCM 18461 TaxID=1291742 RepID=A0A0A1GVP4_9LACO|nr:NAD(P)H-binding protein [Paucilactobacillus hokkaidonensis]BAP86327.1 short-chain dehydrogenase [Paucilactobacillus hokkaidonensis JCM 18461]
MKITLLGSVGNINRYVIPALVSAGHTVTVVTHSDKRTAAIKQLGAIPAVGSMTDESFLTDQFTGADVIYLMLSGGTNNDALQAAKDQGKIFYNAAKAAGVKNIVNLSSIGADSPYDEVGVLSYYHFIEAALLQLDQVNIAVVRPVGFYANLYSSISTIKQQQQIVSTVPAKIKRAFASPKDIAATIIPLLETTPKGHTMRYVVSDEATGSELLAALQNALNMPQLKYVTISDDQFLTALLNQGMPKDVAEGFMIMTRAQRTPEKSYADLKAHQPEYGQVKLADFAKEFASVYRGESQGHSNTLADH